MKNDEIIHNPSVTIVMPSCNSVQFINDSVNSILMQNYSNWHLIIVDDFSTDGTKDLLQKWKKNPRITIIFLERNLGAATARQVAIDYSKGDYVAFCDSDDLWHPNKLKEQIIFMKKNKYDFTYTLYSPFKNKNKPYKPVIYSKSKNYFGMLIHSVGNSTVIVNGNICRSTEIPKIRKRNDYLYFLQLIKKAKNAYLLNKVLTYYRLNENGLSKQKFDLIKYHWIVYRKYEKFDVFSSIFLIFLVSLRKLSSIFYTKF